MLDVGSTLSERYILREVIARGGMGEVWRADDSERDRVVAIKTLLPALSADENFAARFRTEATAMAVLRDPAIVEILDFGRNDGIDYIVMDYIEGESLRALMYRSGPLPADRVMRLVSQAAAALHLAHEQGIVHRDVKPSNLLVRPDDGLVLTDFGIARMVSTARLTAVGSVLGTVTYLAPEQITGAPVSPATDIYSLGVVAYECLAGVPPFANKAPLEVAMSHTRDDPPPLPDHVPFPVRRVVLRALAKDPADRWPTASAMASAAAKAATVTPRPMSAGGGASRVRRAARDAPVPAAAVAEADPPDVTAPPDSDPARRGRRPVKARRWSQGLFLFGVAMIAAITVSVVTVALHLRGPAVASAQSDLGAAPVDTRTAGAELTRPAESPGGQPPTTPPPAPAATRATAPVSRRGAAAPPAATTRSTTATRVAGTGTTTTTSDATPPASPTPTPSASPSPSPSASPSPSPPPVKVTVIDYTTWTEADAVASLTGAGLLAAVVHVPDAGCAVISQSPVGGTQVDAGSTVQLTVATGTCPA